MEIATHAVIGVVGMGIATILLCWALYGLIPTSPEESEK